MDILDYAKNARAGFAEQPFGDIDSALLSQLAYVSFPQAEFDAAPDGCPNIRDFLKAEYFDDMFARTSEPEKNGSLFLAVCFSPRFRGTRLCLNEQRFDREATMQFAAITYLLPDGTAYCAFRGTDSTFVGWREDFYLALEHPVAAQVAGAEYLCAAAKVHSGPIIAGGHSKGGNIAVYSAAACAETLGGRLTAVYSHDGPGFRTEQLESAEFCRILPLIHKTVPQASLVGMLFREKADTKIVKSSAPLIQQHSIYNWAVEENDFIRKDELTAPAKILDSSLDKLVEDLSPQDARILADLLFDTLESTGAESFSGFSKVLLRNLPRLADELTSMSRESRELLRDVVQSLAEGAFDGIIAGPGQENK